MSATSSRRAFLAVAMAACAVVLACGSPQFTTTELKVEGMVCDSCSQALTHALEKLDGVQSARVSHEDGLAVVEHDVNRVAPKDLVAAVEGLGYHARARATLDPGEPGGN